MKKLILLITVFLMTQRSFSQTGQSVSGRQDTSYSNNSALQSDKKKYPDIKLVQEFHFDMVLEKKNIVYCRIGERELLLDAFYPEQKSTTKRTAIIIIHGGGWRSGSRTQHYPLAQKLASLGYVCFTPEYRLSTEALYPAAVYDIKAAIKWVKENAGKYNIDTTRITALGFSAGGQLAALMGATNGDRDFEGKDCNSNYSADVQAVVDMDGILAFIHPESGEGDDSKKISAATSWFGYSKKDKPELWNKASALTHAGKHTPPTLFINSAVNRMHAGREDYIKILKGFNVYTEVHYFENSPHSFCLYEPWFEPTVKYIDDFFKKVFKAK